MIKSKSWEISAWNPKDSVMFRAVRVVRRDGSERKRGTYRRAELFIWSKSRIGTHRSPFEKIRPQREARGELDPISKT